MRTSPSSPSSAGWASSRSPTSGALRVAATVGADQRAGASGRSFRSSCSSVAVGRVFASTGGSLVDLARARTRRRPTSSTSARVEFKPGEIRDQGHATRSTDDLTIASVTVDDAIVPFRLDGPQTLGRLRSSDDRRPVRLGRGRADLGRRDELDRHPDDAGCRPPPSRRPGLERGLPRLRADRLPRRRRADRARPRLASVAPPRDAAAGSPRSWL